MQRRIRAELRQTKPFASIEEEVVVQIQLTAQVVLRWAVEGLEESGLTPAQYNVLRILRGASPECLSASQICERMIARDPDLTRLLDRLEAMGMIRKERDGNDRRVVNVHITAAGRKTTEAATTSMRARAHESLRGMEATRLGQLADLLEMVRGNRG